LFFCPLDGNNKNKEYEVSKFFLWYLFFYPGAHAPFDGEGRKACPAENQGLGGGVKNTCQSEKKIEVKVGI
jgi:hypothetical protein